MKTPTCSAVIENRFLDVLDEPVWVCWSEIDRAGRKVKLPINPLTGRTASVAEPGTWTSYRKANFFRRKTGVGIVLTSTLQGHLVGLDLDSCRDPETGFIEDWAKTVLSAVPSYAEISPSGGGLKIFAIMADDQWQAAKALLSSGVERLGASWKEDGQHHPPGVELYLGGRYFTVTGLDHGGRPLRKISLADVASTVRFCQERFKKRPLSAPTTHGGTTHVSTTHVSTTQGRDDSESGRAFRICIAAVRSGVPMDKVPEWAARRAAWDGHANFAVSPEYWLKPRNEGTQLSRDYVRAEAVVAKLRT